MTVLAREDATEARLWQLPEVGAGTRAPPPNLRTLRQLEDVEQRAREDGYAAGLAEGRAAARAEVAAQVTRIQSIVAALAAAVRESRRGRRERARIARDDRCDAHRAP